MTNSKTKLGLNIVLRLMVHFRLGVIFGKTLLKDEKFLYRAISSFTGISREDI